MSSKSDEDVTEHTTKVTEKIGHIIDETKTVSDVVLLERHLDGKHTSLKRGDLSLSDESTNHPDKSRLDHLTTLSEDLSLEYDRDGR